MALLTITPQNRVDTTVRNINWLLIYWRCIEPRQDDDTGTWMYNDACPDPVCPDYGFARGRDGKGAVQWLEEVA